MNELVNRIVEKVGIPEETAKQAADVVLAYLKEHLPAPIASQVENYLGGEGASGAMESAKGLMGRTFGKE